jgi:subtilisin family serine protease
MARTAGNPSITIGLIDGPVALDQPGFAASNIKTLAGHDPPECAIVDSFACQHGTFVAGILAARRGSVAPAICPDCTLLVRPIFRETGWEKGALPAATPEELARSILDCVEAGARVLNVSAALARPSSSSARAVEEALDLAARRGVIVVVAAGNQSTLGSTVLTAHHWVIPVAGYNRDGRPTDYSNLGSSIGRRGVGAPADRITSTGAIGEPLTLGGTSAAAPFVTGAVALLWSEFPRARPAAIRFATTQANARRRRTVVPPLLDAWAGYQMMLR